MEFEFSRLTDSTEKAIQSEPLDDLSDEVEPIAYKRSTLNQDKTYKIQVRGLVKDFKDGSKTYHNSKIATIVDGDKMGKFLSTYGGIIKDYEYRSKRPLKHRKNQRKLHKEKLLKKKTNLKKEVGSSA